jgi:hypothetical protein
MKFLLFVTFVLPPTLIHRSLSLAFFLHGLISILKIWHSDIGGEFYRRKKLDWVGDLSVR